MASESEQSQKKSRTEGLVDKFKSASSTDDKLLIMFETMVGTRRRWITGSGKSTNSLRGGITHGHAGCPVGCI